MSERPPMSDVEFQHHLVDYFGELLGHTSEQLAEGHYRVDHPWPIGSPEWVAEEAALHLAIEEAKRRNKEIEREIRANRPDPNIIGSVNGRPVYRTTPGRN